MLRLHHAPRSRSSRIVWLLEELGAECEIVYTNIARMDGSGDEDPANPHPDKKVPALVHNGALITESSAIVLYLTDLKRSRVFKTLIALVAASLMGLVAVPSQANVTPSQTINESTVGMQMFMWNWKSVGNECRTTLGPNGVNWILVMPPQESISGSAWWTHYQPVSYAIDSEMGTRAEFAAMVAKCNEAGVDVIADAVINHMAAGKIGRAHV